MQQRKERLKAPVKREKIHNQEFMLVKVHNGTKSFKGFPGENYFVSKATVKTHGRGLNKGLHTSLQGLLRYVICEGADAFD